MCTLEFCFSGDCLYFQAFGKLHQVALSLYTLLSIIFPPLLHSLFLYVFFETLLSQLSHTCSFFMHGRALCQLLSCVKRSSEGFRYIFTAKWWKKKPFSEIGKQWFIYFSQRLSVFKTLCAIPATCHSNSTPGALEKAQNSAPDIWSMSRKLWLKRK